MNTLKNRLTFLVVTILIVFSSCNNSETNLTKYGPVFNAVVVSDQGVFRGFNIGDSQEIIKTKETKKPIEEDKNYLYYEYSFDSTCVYNITYNFDEFGLKEIQSEIYLNDTSNIESVMKNFKLYFDDHYGASEYQMGFNVWSVKSDKFDEVKITISDETTDFSSSNFSGKIAIWIYANLD